MEDLTNYKIDFPFFLWSPKKAKTIINEHKDQIHFLNEEGTKLIQQLLFTSKMIGTNDNEDWHFFYKNYFKDVKSISILEGF
ncbi:hypothetical protein [Winogradskyella sp.]|uniref:hypothetical protein n=1 Tax=Winogradskyella sp. TaxID=1883156 RepID=UPI00261C772D|nr:hypothetical protein [Winogradskyella sp.]